MNTIPQAKESEVIRLLQKGYSLRTVARLTEVDKNTVHRVKIGKLPFVPKQKPTRPDPDGFCQCGCGCRTTRLQYDDPVRGLKAGQFARFKHAHYHNLKRALDPSWGEHSRRTQLQWERKEALVVAVLSSGGIKSLDEIRQEVAPEFRLEGASKMINNARRLGLWGPIPSILVRRPRKAFVPYVRMEIPYERETEIPLLVNRRSIQALDAPHPEFETSYYDYLASTAESPLELLMLKEEMESEEYQDRQRRIREWQLWNERQKPFNIGELVHKAFESAS